MKAYDEQIELKIPVYDRGMQGQADVDNNYWTDYVQKNFGDKYLPNDPIVYGSKDGAQVGQTLEVYRVVNESRTSERGDLFKKNYIGEVVIGSIVDDHFARASVNSGDVKKHDVVELKK